MCEVVFGIQKNLYEVANWFSSCSLYLNVPNYHHMFSTHSMIN